MRISDWSSDVCSSDLREVASGSLSVDGSGVEAGVGGATPSTGAASGFDVDFFPPISRANRSHASTVMSSAAVFATNAFWLRAATVRPALPGPGARSWRVDPGAGIGFHRGPARPDQRRSTPLCRARGDPARASGGPSPNLRLSLLFGAGRTGFARMDRSGSRGGDIE